MPTTEIATLTLTPGSDIGDPNNAASATLNECGNVLVKQPGLLALRFGPQVEDSSKMQMFISECACLNLLSLPQLSNLRSDWESTQRHHDFMAGEDYPPFLEKMKTIMAGPPSFAHVDFDTDGLASALKAPVTEVATFYFNEKPPDAYLPGVVEFVKACAADAGTGNGPTRYALGTTHELIEKDGVKGQ